MTYSIFFCTGIALGFTLGIATWAACLFLGKKAALGEYQKVLVKAKTDAILEKRRMDEAINKVRAQYPEMSSEQSRIAEEELSKVFSSRER